MNMKCEAGFTLMELILAILLISIVGVAAFTGFQFAFLTLSSADEFSENVYLNQESFENHLTYSRTIAFSQAFSSGTLDTELGVDTLDLSTQTMIFSWDNSRFNGSYEDLNDFDSVGIVVEADSIGGMYLDKGIYTFIPLYTTVP